MGQKESKAEAQTGRQPQRQQPRYGYPGYPQQAGQNPNAPYQGWGSNPYAAPAAAYAPPATRPPQTPAYQQKPRYQTPYPQQAATPVTYPGYSAPLPTTAYAAPAAAFPAGFPSPVYGAYGAQATFSAPTYTATSPVTSFAAPTYTYGSPATAYGGFVPPFYGTPAAATVPTPLGQLPVAQTSYAAPVTSFEAPVTAFGFGAPTYTSGFPTTFNATPFPADAYGSYAPTYTGTNFGFPTPFSAPVTSAVTTSYGALPTAATTFPDVGFTGVPTYTSSSGFSTAPTSAPFPFTTPSSTTFPGFAPQAFGGFPSAPAPAQPAPTPSS